MPFTGSHPAAVVPLFGTALPASALVIGSMSPDIPYFFQEVSGITHTVVGIFTIDLLLGGGAWLVWHGLLAAPAVAVAPWSVRVRLAGRADPGLMRRVSSVRHVLLVALALIVGAATHVGWDAFTHDGRWGVRHLPFLTVMWHGHPVYAWAQYASGVFGAVVLTSWLVWWWRTTTPAPVPQVQGPAWEQAGWAWPALLTAGAVTGFAAALHGHSLHTMGFRAVTYGAAVVVGLGAVLALAWHGLSLRRAVAVRGRPPHRR